MKWTTTTEGRKAKGKILDLLEYYWWTMLMVLGVGRFAFLSIEYAVAVAADSVSQPPPQILIARHLIRPIRRHIRPPR
jgi:hypothetical protein